MRNSIKDYIGKSFILESYSVGFLNEDKKFQIKNSSDARMHLSDVTRMLQNMVSNSSYYENIDPKELFEIALYFSDKLQSIPVKNFIDTEWDFNGWKNNKNFFGEKNDWVQTFFGRINECTTGIRMTSPEIKSNSLTIRSHISLKFLFLMLEYYNHANQKLGKIYDVEFVTDIEEDSIEITLNNKTAKIKIKI